MIHKRGTSTFIYYQIPTCNTINSTVIWLSNPTSIGLPWGMYFWRTFWKFLTFDRQKLAPKNMHVNWHTWLRSWHVVWLVKWNITCPLTFYKWKWCVLRGMWHWCRWRFRRKCRCQFYLKMSHDTLDLKLHIKWNLSNIQTPTSWG